MAGHLRFKNLDDLVVAAEDVVKLGAAGLKQALAQKPEMRTPRQQTLIRLNAALRPFRRT